MIDLQKINELYHFDQHIDFEDIQIILQLAQREHFEKGTYLLEIDSMQKKAFFIEKGLLRAFTIDHKGDEVTTLLRWENQFMVDTKTILFDMPSSIYIEALENTITYSMDIREVQQLVSNDLKLQHVRNLVLRAELIKAYQRIDSFILNSAEERYLAFIDRNREVLHRIPDKYIANVLGITAVSLSRIRKRMANRSE